MSFTPDKLARILHQLPPAGRYILAFSGGLDSAVLLHALHTILPGLNASLVAVHIDHGLSPLSREWAEHCREFCVARGVALEVMSLDLQCAKGESIEACAREARYRALESRLQPGDALLTAHHQDDLAETFVLHALRGSGVEGLSAIAPVRPFGGGRLMRPLLAFKREDLEGYAETEGLHWVDDPSNDQTRFDRNYLRHVVMPVLKRRWPGAAATLSRSARNCAEAASIVSERADDDMQAVIRGTTLDTAMLGALSPARQRAVLRLWISSFGLSAPDHSRLTELQRQLAEAADDRQPVIAWADMAVRHWRGRLHMTGPLPPLDPGIRLAWPVVSEVLDLPADLGSLEIEGDMPVDHLEVCFRKGGETCYRGGCHRPLKKLLQELGVPPWLRERIPLVFAAGKLVAVGDYLLCDGWPEDAGLVWTRGAGWTMNSDQTQPAKNGGFGT